MGKFFRNHKYSSFQRQLNLYGFTRISFGRDSNCYYHEYFLRGHAHLHSHLSLTRIKGTKVRASSDPRREPNFYEMKYVYGTSLLSDIQDAAKWEGNMELLDDIMKMVIPPTPKNESYSNKAKNNDDEKWDNNARYESNVGTSNSAFSNYNANNMKSSNNSHASSIWNTLASSQETTYDHLSQQNNLADRRIDHHPYYYNHPIVGNSGRFIQRHYIYRIRNRRVLQTTRILLS